MADRNSLIEARLPRGFEDRAPADIAATDRMIATIKKVYEKYGFDPVETPFLEYTETLGKFLPDTDRPNAGVFSLQDDDEQWMSLRYDLTAPLARYFAQNYDRLPKPFRSYRAGYVFRNEKPGPGRFRQFMQFDADTVGAAGPEADAEMCMMMADTMDALGLAGKYVVKVNNRKVLDGVLENAGIVDATQKLTVLRAIDKLDRLGVNGVKALLGKGRVDDSGDFTPGAGLSDSANNAIVQLVSTLDFEKNPDLLPSTYTAGLPAEIVALIGRALNETVKKSITVREAKAAELASLPNLSLEQINAIFDFVLQPVDLEWTTTEEPMTTIGGHGYVPDYKFNLRYWRKLVGENQTGLEGIAELEAMARLFTAGRYRNRIDIVSDTVRGLEYYTGPVFEIELTFPVTNEKGEQVVFGSVGGGGRYDGLVSRFRAEPVPATGFSIGVSRLAHALKLTGNIPAEQNAGPVVILVLDRDAEAIADYQKMTSELRSAGIRAEMYLGLSGMNAQMKYADRRNAAAAVIVGSNERAEGKVTIKDLVAGAEQAKAIKDNAEYKAAKVGQWTAARADLVAELSKIPAIARMRGND
jgi:histidyl-tRNA synthetase